MALVTTSIAHETSRRPGRRPRTLATSLAAACLSAAMAAGIGNTGHEWPSSRYRDDPVAFARDVLGVEPWLRQVELLEAIRDHKRVAVASGHKVSKSHSFAAAALWFYCSFPDARVVMSSTTSRQVDQILWRELRMMHARAGRCAECKRKSPGGPTPCPHSATIGGKLGQLARSGLKSEDFREIVGFTAREAEAVAGVSGKNLLYLVDEASGVPDIIFEAIEGNRAGGARVALFGNPTRTEGEHFEAFHGKSEFYFTIRISSEETPNVITGREVVPGLATREWVEEKRREWGEDSPMYRIRVKGEHVLGEDGKILSVHDIAEAEARWADTPAKGRLYIGLDPAGPGEGGDESVFTPRRGLRSFGAIAKRGLSEEAHLVHLLGLCAEHRERGERPPIVVIDRDGPIGVKVLRVLRAHADERPQDFEILAVRSSDRARRDPKNYDRIRDELWANLAQWMVEGGSFPEDARLAKELHAPEWIGQLNGRVKATDKKTLRKLLGRSPDRADSLALAVWESSALEHAEPGSPPAPEPDAYDRVDPPTTGIDPYAGVDWLGGRRS